MGVNFRLARQIIAEHLVDDMTESICSDPFAMCLRQKLNIQYCQIMLMIDVVERFTAIPDVFSVNTVMPAENILIDSSQPLLEALNRNAQTPGKADIEHYLAVVP